MSNAIAKIETTTDGVKPLTPYDADFVAALKAAIRHNRARGVHTVDRMSEIVVELSRRNWSNEKIGAELGMEPDEVLRMKQITGLAELFAEKEFSQAWEIG